MGKGSDKKTTKEAEEERYTSKREKKPSQVKHRKKTRGFVLMENQE